MILESIKTERCPFCGCPDVVCESVETTVDGNVTTVKVHTNGRKWEQRHFACGYKVEYVPNFYKEREIGKCNNDPTEVERRKREDELENELFEFIVRMDCSAETRNKILNKILYGRAI